MSNSPDLIVTKSYMSLVNESSNDLAISSLSTNNVLAGQILILDKYTERNEKSGDPQGKIYLQGIIDPSTDFSTSGNLILPRIDNGLDSDLEEGGDFSGGSPQDNFNLLEIKNTRQEATNTSYDLVEKTVVQLIYDGSFWKVISHVTNEYLETN